MKLNQVLRCKKQRSFSVPWTDQSRCLPQTCNTDSKGQPPYLELIKVDAALDDGLGGPAGLHEGDDEGGGEEVQALVGGLDPEGGAAHKGQHAEPGVPVHHLAGPRRRDDVSDGLGEQHTPGA